MENNDDMKEAIEIMSGGLDPAGLVTHIGGLDAVPDTTNRLPEIPGGKKLIYTHINLPLTPIDDFEKLGVENELFRELAKICKLTAYRLPLTAYRLQLTANRLQLTANN